MYKNECENNLPQIRITKNWRKKKKNNYANIQVVIKRNANLLPKEIRQVSSDGYRDLYWNIKARPNKTITADQKASSAALFCHFPKLFSQDLKNFHSERFTRSIERNTTYTYVILSKLSFLSEKKGRLRFYRSVKFLPVSFSHLKNEKEGLLRNVFLVCWPLPPHCELAEEQKEIQENNWNNTEIC